MNQLRIFLQCLALGMAIEKANEQVTTETGTQPEFYTLDKSAGAAVQLIRITNGVSEGNVMKALQLDPAKPQDLQTYMAFEAGHTQLDMTPEAITALSKVLKTDTATLASKLLAPGSTTAAAAQTPAAAGAAGATGAAGAAAAGAAGAAAAGAAGSGAVHASATGDTDLVQLRKSLTTEQVAAVDRVLLKSRQVKTVEGGTMTITKSADEIKLEKAIVVGRALSGLTEDSSLAKSGISVEADFAPSGTLNPTLGRDLMLVAQPQMKLLGRVQQVIMTSYNEEVLIATMPRRTAVRLVPGTAPTAAQTQRAGNVSKILVAADLDFIFTLADTLALQYQGNLPGLEQKLMGFFTGGIATQPEDLGINGTTDTYTPDQFLTLRKGWLAKATAAATSGNAWRLVDASVSSITTVTGMLDKLKSQMFTNQPVNSQLDNVFIVSVADFETYAAECRAARKSDDLLFGGVPKKYDSKEIVVCDFMPTGYYMYTPLQNLVFGYVNGGTQGMRMSRDRVTKATQWTLSLGAAFEIADYDACVVGQP